MPVNRKVLQDYIDEHKSHYIGKYKYRCGYRIGEYASKCHYYMLDENFRNIDIYVDLNYQNRVTFSFSENLNDQEKQYIVKDALSRILYKENYQSLLHYSLYEQYITTSGSDGMHMAPMDYVDIFDYMKYHRGINQKTVDEFYKIYIPSLERLRTNGDYDTYLESLILLFRSMLYEYEWDGPNSKYLDSEYQFHLYYIREVLRAVYRELDKFYEEAREPLFRAIEILCQHERFTFSIMTDFGTMVLSQARVMDALTEELKQHFVLYDRREDDQKNINLVFSYIYWIYKSDFDQYRGVTKHLFRHIISNMLTFANHDLDLALGNALLAQDGYEILLDLFHEDYNTFIFTCFPISSFPVELKPSVREQLVAAIRFFAGRMENDKYKLSSFEQVTNINRLLLDNFREWYK